MGLLLFGLAIIPFAHGLSFPEAAFTPKWAATYGLAVAAALLWLIHGSRSTQFFRKSQVAAGLILLAWLIVSIWRHGTPLTESSLLERAAFCLLFLYFLDVAKRNLVSVRMFMCFTVLVAVIACLDAVVSYIPYYVSTTSPSFELIMGRFGNVNMFAQFLGLAAPFAFALLLNETSWRKYAAGLASVFLLILIYYTACRSIYIATLSVGAMYLIGSSWRQRGELFLVALCAFVAVVIFKHTVEKKTYAFYPKPTSSASRLEVLKETMELVRKNPAGIGAGGFEFSFIPFEIENSNPPNEQQIMKTPHNSFLHIASEQGVAYLVLLLGLAVGLLWPARRWLLGEEGKPFLGAFIVTLVEALFQFPMENAYPTFLLSFILAFTIAKTTPTPAAQLPRFSPVLVVILGIYLSVFSWKSVRSRYLEGLSVSNADLASIACEQDPNNWRACLRAADFFAATGQKDEARSRVAEELRKRPFSYPAIRSWANMQLVQGDEFGACLAFLVYDSIFRGESSVSPLVNQVCAPETRALFANKSFMAAHTAWSKYLERKSAAQAHAAD